MGDLYVVEKKGVSRKKMEQDLAARRRRKMVKTIRKVRIKEAG